MLDLDLCGLDRDAVLQWFRGVLPTLKANMKSCDEQMHSPNIESWFETVFPSTPRKCYLKAYQVLEHEIGNASKPAEPHIFDLCCLAPQSLVMIFYLVPGDPTRLEFVAGLQIIKPRTRNFQSP